MKLIFRWMKSGTILCQLELTNIHEKLGHVY